MSPAFCSHEIREPQGTHFPAPPFEDTIDGVYVARDEAGRLYHRPGHGCFEWEKGRWCHHLVSARAHAEHPESTLQYEVINLVNQWADGGYAGGIGALAHGFGELAIAAEERLSDLNAWTKKHEATIEERRARAKDALARHSSSTIRPVAS